MNEQWQSFLKEQGANIVDAEVSDFGNPEQEIQMSATGDIFFSLSGLGILTVTGEDASTFLQGQITHDIGQVDNTHSVLCGYCTPQGRLLALMRIFSTCDHQYHLIMPRMLIDSTRQRLQMFVMMSRVELRDDSDHLVGLGLHGPEAIRLCQQLLPQPPAKEAEVSHHEGLTVLRLADAHHPRYALYGHHEVLQRCWNELNVHAAPVGSSINAYLDIVTGMPTILPATVDKFIPQHIDLDHLNGISFSKGCYTGQEIIARLHYRGKSKRRLFRLNASGNEPWPPATNIIDSKHEDQSLGMVIDSQKAPDGKMIALASLISADISAAELTIADQTTAAITAVAVNHSDGEDH